MNPFVYFTIGASLFSLLGLACVFFYGMEKRIATRRLISMTRKKTAPGMLKQSHTRAGAALVLHRVQALLIRLPVQFMRVNSLPGKLARAGYRSPHAADVFIAIRVLGPLVGFLLAFIPAHRGILPLALPAAGYLLPDMILRRHMKTRCGQIRDSLPDAIDLLVICVEAGLGMDQAMHRVSQELSLRHPAITEEFTRLNLEQRAGKPRIQAWQAMAQRLDIEEITGFLNMLIQTERFGTPISKALSNFAENMREKRRQRAEERAAKTSVKITLPLALFIFPSIFIVLLGPAFLNLLHTFPNFGH